MAKNPKNFFHSKLIYGSNFWHSIFFFWLLSFALSAPATTSKSLGNNNKKKKKINKNYLLSCLVVFPFNSSPILLLPQLLILLLLHASTLLWILAHSHFYKQFSASHAISFSYDMFLPRPQPLCHGFLCETCCRCIVLLLLPACFHPSHSSKIT